VFRDKVAELAAKVVGVTHSTVPVADDCLCDQCGEVVWVAPADTLYGNGDVGGSQRVVADTDLRTNKVGRLLLLRSK